MGMPLFLRYSSDIVFFAAGLGAFLFSQTATQQVPPIHFQDVAQRAGLRFVLENNPTPRKHMIETMAGGVAAFDYNGDGLTDIFFTNGAVIPSLEKESRRSAAMPKGSSTMPPLSSAYCSPRSARPASVRSGSITTTMACSISSLPTAA